MEEKTQGSFKDTLITLFLAALIAFFIRSFWFEPFRIPSGSMYPTLQVGDFLFVSKYTYGYSKHSFPLSSGMFEGRVWYDAPQRGDVVVFKYPQDNKTDYIKRVIGLPGDKIKIENGRLYINGEIVEREQTEDYVIFDNAANMGVYPQYIEKLPNGVEHRILEISDNAPLDNMAEVTVPEDHFFMMGDNRDRSDDSRAHVGFVPKENLVGKARILFFSYGENGLWYNPLTWNTKMRWGRFLNKIK